MSTLPLIKLKRIYAAKIWHTYWMRSMMYCIHVDFDSSKYKILGSQILSAQIHIIYSHRYGISHIRWYHPTLGIYTYSFVWQMLILYFYSEATLLRGCSVKKRETFLVKTGEAVLRTGLNPHCISPFGLCQPNGEILYHKTKQTQD